MSMQNMVLKRYDILFADLSPVVGSEQGGTRPVLVIQNNMGNANSPTTIVAAITKSKTKAIIPTHFYIDTANGLLTEKSMVLFEQIRTIDKSRIKRKVGHLSLSEKQQQDLEHCLEISVLGKCFNENLDATENNNLIGKNIDEDEYF